MYYLQSLGFYDKETVEFALIILFANIFVAASLIAILFLKQRKFSNAFAVVVTAALLGYVLWYTYPNWL